MKERETSLSVIDDNGVKVPKVSFGNTGHASQITSQVYDIAENEIVAFYDGAHKLIFVIDGTITADKPNALLVIEPVGERNWGDILENDYGVDLETVRPKVDNRYQKLDIEYGGLSVYNRLINEYNAGANNDVDGALGALAEFRLGAVRRAETERLNAANETIRTTTRTISKTDATITEEMATIRALREKLVAEKKSVGRVPTKSSAAKILKIESQIDAANEKLNRSRRRLGNARRRMRNAEQDAAAANEILARNKPKAQQMAEEVKPLFDKDPEILDENIAFKPIEFDIGDKKQVTSDMDKVVEETPTPEPIAFVPPDYTAPAYTPVVDLPDAVPTFAGDTTDKPTPTPMPDSAPEIIPVVPQPAPAPTPEARLASPMTGGVTAIPVDGVGDAKRPNILYYVLLVVLIALSIFTLWLYQKNTTKTNVPDLTAGVAAPTFAEAPAGKPAIEPAPIPTPIVPIETPAVVEESPFIQVAPTVAEPEPVVSVQESVEPHPEPVFMETVEIPGVQEPVAEPTPPAEPAPAPTPVVDKPTFAEALVDKPAYDVSNEHTFVADENYNASPKCEDGMLPNVYGCCSGETATSMGDGTIACCVGGGQCYPPLK